MRADYEEVCDPKELAPPKGELPAEQVIQIEVLSPPATDRLIQLAREHKTPDGRCGIQIMPQQVPALHAFGGLKGAILEPTFGCDVLSADPQDWRRTFWRLRLPPAAQGTSKAELKFAQTIMVRSDGTIRAKVLPTAKPPGFSDRYVGRAAKISRIRQPHAEPSGTCSTPAWSMRGKNGRRRGLRSRVPDRPFRGRLGYRWTITSSMAPA